MVIGCGKKNMQKPANMEEIYREQGVPIKIQTVALQEFIKEIEFSVTVSGIREAQVNSRIGDQIERIRAKLGDQVNQNQIIIDFPQDNPQASFFQAKAAYELAQQTWHRMQTLHQTGGISQQDLDGAETQFKVAQANWDAVQQSVHVRAPFSGMITDINVRETEKVASGDYLFTVAQLNKLHGRIWIAESDINSVPKNAEVIFRWNDIEKKARVTNLALSLNRDFNAFAADIEIENPDYAIRSGVTGKAILVLYKNSQAVVVPRNIVRKDIDGQYYVFLAQDNKAIQRKVTIRNESELNYEIQAGLNLGDQLIVQGYQMIQENTKINY